MDRPLRLIPRLIGSEPRTPLQGISAQVPPRALKAPRTVALDARRRQDSDLRDRLSPFRSPPHGLSTPTHTLNPSRGRVADTRCEPGSTRTTLGAPPPSPLGT